MQNKKLNLYLLKWLFIALFTCYVSSLLCTLFLGPISANVTFVIGLIIGQLCVEGYIDDEDKERGK